MKTIERLRPDPIPSIHPMPEYLATGQRARWYEETKHALQVPWMGVVTMAYSHYPTFFGELWRGLKPLCQSRPFVDAFRGLRGYVESRVAELKPASLIKPLEEMGYAPREIDAIRQMNSVFSHGNQLYVLIATIARHLLEFGDIKGAADAEPFEGRHAPDVEVPFMLLEPHHADEPTRAVYEDIKTVLRLPGLRLGGVHEQAAGDGASADEEKGEDGGPECRSIHVVVLKPVPGGSSAGLAFRV